MATICLRRRLPGASSDRYPRARRATVNALLFGLAPGGVYLAGRSPGRRWALTPPFHPYLAARLRRFTLPGGFFLWHFPSVRPDWVLPIALLCGARTFLQRYLLRRRSPVRLGPPVSLPTQLRKHAPGACGEEPAVGDLEQAVDEVAHKPLRLAVHADHQDASSVSPGPHLHAPRSACLGRVGLLDCGRDHRFPPLVPLDRPDAQAVRAFAHPRPAFAAIQHLEGWRQVRPQLRAPGAELSQPVPNDLWIQLGLDRVGDFSHRTSSAGHSRRSPCWRVHRHRDSSLGRRAPRARRETAAAAESLSREAG